jgi:hypothetical protein
VDWDDMTVGNVEYRLAEASGDFLVALRMNEGFKDDLYKSLTSILAECEIEWWHKNCIPRLAVNVLVDLVVAT